MIYRIRDRKRWQRMPRLLAASSGGRFPTGRLYVVWTTTDRTRRPRSATDARLNDVEFVFTPTNASWLNWIECEFTALRYFTRDGWYTLPALCHRYASVWTPIAMGKLTEGFALWLPRRIEESNE